MNTSGYWVAVRSQQMATTRLGIEDFDNQFVKQVQLDAMKEVMRRAANQVGMQWDSQMTKVYQVTQARNNRQSILTASEQLTIKDL